MRFKKVLLVNPYYLGRGGLRPPVTLGVLGEILKLGEVDYHVLDMTLGYGKRTLRREIIDYKPDLIAISMMTYTYLRIFDLISYIKKNFPLIRIMAGGAHISTFREEALRECSALDYGWVYECEEGLVNFCKGQDFSSIKGLLYRKGEEIIYTGDSSFIKNLDDYPFPKYDKFELTKYLKEIDILTSRGCPYSCVFCPMGNASGKTMRYRSAEDVLSEIEYWYKNGYREFTIADDNFTINKKRAIRILDLIREAHFKDTIFRAATGLRADLLDKEILEKMKRVGFTHLSIGVESASNRMLKLMKKGEMIETIEKTIKLACDMGFDVILFFVVGSISETYEDFLKSLKFAKKYPILNAIFSNMTPYPKTEMYGWVKENGTFIADYPQYLNRHNRSFDYLKPLFYTKEFTYKERCKALKLRSKVSREILRKALKRKLKRFGIFGTIIAFFGSFYFIYDIIINTKILRKIAEKFVLKN